MPSAGSCRSEFRRKRAGQPGTPSVDGGSQAYNYHGKTPGGFYTGIGSVSAYLLGIYLSCRITPEILGEAAMVFSLSGPQLIILVMLLIFLSCLFAAIEIFAGFITRSVREAQLLAMPLLTVGMGAVYISQNLDLAGRAWFYIHIPLVNIALAVRETALDRILLSDIVTVFIWIICYLAFITFLAIRMFQKESGILKNSRP